MADRINVNDNTLFIGDNLDNLRGLNSESVDLVYLDPPRNSGRIISAHDTAEAAGFAFDDRWTLDDMRTEWLDEIELRQPDMVPVINATKVAHDDGMAAYLTFMGVRLLELRRILKPTGSIYLQCNPRAAHYLKALMDALFGHEQFKSDVTWKRMAMREGPKRWVWTHDTLLFYAGPREYAWNQVPQEHPPEYWKKYYFFSDDRGNYQAQPLTGLGRIYDDRGEPWRDIDPAEEGRHWEVPMKVLRAAYPLRGDLNRLDTARKLDLLDEAGLIHWTRGGAPRYKIYADMTMGERLSDVVTTVARIESKDREYTGWPEQVPEALLDIIVRASTDPGDIVLDPFCGSGTACVVAEMLGRRWIGIERAEQAPGVLTQRMEREVGRQRFSTHERRPWRTDEDESHERMDPVEARNTLYERQQGKCQGCEHVLPAPVLTFDRVDRASAAQVAGIDDLQLLCHFCKSLRGRNSMDHLRLQLFRRGVLR